MPQYITGQLKVTVCRLTCLDVFRAGYYLKESPLCMTTYNFCCWYMVIWTAETWWDMFLPLIFWNTKCVQTRNAHDSKRDASCIAYNALVSTINFIIAVDNALQKSSASPGMRALLVKSELFGKLLSWRRRLRWPVESLVKAPTCGVAVCAVVQFCMWSVRVSAHSAEHTIG
jgi:hypothetical protein